MTRERDIDQLVRTFVQEGPEELSPRLSTSIRDEIRGTRQRAYLRPWRTLSMPRPILIFAILGAILLASGAVFFAGAGNHAALPSLPPSTIVASPTPTPTPLFTPSPTFSPYPLSDGDPWIVLADTSGGATLIRPDGTGSHQILQTRSMVVNVPNWSPDGRQIVFEGTTDAGSQIWIANADGSAARQLTPTPAGCPNETCTEAGQPAWSPDGRSIAFIAPTRVGGTFTTMSLMTLDVATGSTTTVYATTTTYLGRPSWSPDSKRIVVEIQRFAGTPEVTDLRSTTIGVIRVDGNDHTPTEITKPDRLAGYPTWHPTKDLIVFRTNRYEPDVARLFDPTKPSNVYTIRPDGTGLKQVTAYPVGVIVRAPTWTDDGRILFSKLAQAGAPELMRVIAADGSGEASATGSVDTEGEARWRPTP